MTIYILLAWLGMAAGSFVGALTWRLHTKRNFVAERSECEHCHHKLGVVDLIPIFSWLALRGKCRYCKKPIGWHTIAPDIALAVLFVASYAFWPVDLAGWQSYASLTLWYVYLIGLAALVVSDLRWMILPDVIVFPLIALGLVDAGLRVSLTPGVSPGDYLWHIITGAAALGGVYYGLYAISGGKWVGFGDVKLGLFIGIVLGWQQALLVLFLANFIGFICILPGLVRGRLGRKTEVPFGQFLIIAFVVAGLFGQQLIDWYTKLLVG